jgi:enolase
MKIKQIKSRQIIDSRGNPTVEADVILESGAFGRAGVPSGASTGEYEMLELRDNVQSDYQGQSVHRAVDNANNLIAEVLIGKDLDQKRLDDTMLELDGTTNKGKLGANAILAVSLAFAWASSREQGKQLFEYIGDLFGNKDYLLPRPMFNIMNGGKHGNWATDFQEYMVVPMKAESWAKRLEIGVNIYHTLRELLKKNGLSINVGDEGGFSPALESNQQALDFMVQAVEEAGYELGEDIMFAFDPAASEFYNEETGMYELKRDKAKFNSDQMIDWASSLAKKYPVISYEDMLAQNDWAGWSKLTSKLGNKIQIVGDDLLVTNVQRVEQAIEQKSCNALLVKVNQIGSLSETLDAMKLAKAAGWNNVVSHRSGETEDITIAHIAVGTGCGQLKDGSPARGERTAKFNELLRIEEMLTRN